jgi:hypothetical protein
MRCQSPGEVNPVHQAAAKQRAERVGIVEEQFRSSQTASRAPGAELKNRRLRSWSWRRQLLKILRSSLCTTVCLCELCG